VTIVKALGKDSKEALDLAKSVSHYSQNFGERKATFRSEIRKKKEVRLS